MVQNSNIYFYGSLRKLFEKNEENPFQTGIPKPIQFLDLLKALKIPLEAIQMIMVNHRAVTPDIIINPGDRIALFPKEYPLFADWKDYRIKN